MKLNKKSAEIFIANKEDELHAIAKTTHMAIGAHQDDLEIMAYHGIEACFQSEENSFFGVVVTNGSGSARDNKFKDYTDEEMIAVRKVEQKAAARLGEFGALALLDYPSKEVKDKNNQIIVKELAELISLSAPKIIYTHNLADKHDTHIGVVTKVIKAIRSLPKDKRPEVLLGCEVWRDLDWLNDDEKRHLDVSNRPDLAAGLVEVFESQIIGGKRYDKATIGRRLANATFSSSHTIDECDAITYAMDLTPLIQNDALSVVDFVSETIDRFRNNVKEKVNRMM